MPAGQFFVMLEAAKKIRNRENVLDCWKSRAATVGREGFEEILAFFETLGTDKVRPEDIQFNPPVEPLKGEAARQALMRVFGSDRRVGTRQVKTVH